MATTLQEQRAALEADMAAAREQMRPLQEALAAMEAELMAPLWARAAELDAAEWRVRLPAYLKEWMDRARDIFGHGDVPDALMQSLLANVTENPTFEYSKHEGKYYDSPWNVYTVSYPWPGVAQGIHWEKMTHYKYSLLSILESVTPKVNSPFGYDLRCQSWKDVMELPEAYRWMAILTVDEDAVRDMCLA